MRLRRKRVLTRQDTDAEAPGTGTPAPGRWGAGSRLAGLVAGLSPREQTLLAVAAGVLLLAAVLGLGVWPALRSLQQSPARHRALDAQIASVARLQAQAQALQALPRWGTAEAAAKLQASSASLTVASGNSAPAGSAAPLQLSLAERQANASLRAMPADALAAWLTAARLQAHAVPTEARLAREAASSPGPEGGDRWGGTLVLRLPP